MLAEVVFDVRQAGYDSWWFPAFGLLFFAFGLVLFAINQGLKRLGLPAIPNRSGKPAPWLPLVFIGFSLLWSLGTFYTTFSGYRHLRTALELGQCRVVEGRIENFHPENPSRGGSDESFDVSGVHISYSANVVSPGFHTTCAKGSPIRDGMRVRIYSKERDIARLEILP
jgi:hypothetical protein